MLKRHLLSLSIFFLAVFVVAPIGVFAYDDETTHPALTQEILEFYGLSGGEYPLTADEREWIIEGSILEDTAPRWINHFYDPVYRSGWTGEHTGEIDSAMVRLLSRIGLSSEKALSSVEWVNSYLIQESYAPYGGNRTWKKALEYYADGNEKEAYKTLGYILHLVEDATVPDHTRNDTHAHALEGATGDPGSPYESYATRWTRKSIKKLDIPGALLDDGVRLEKKPAIEEYIIAASEYSNKYFFSRDTINDPKYEFPKIVREDETFGYGLDEKNIEFPITGIAKKFPTPESVGGLVYSIDVSKEHEKILSAYFTRLSRQAVLHGAGVVDLFQRQAADALINKEFPTSLVRIDPSFAGRFPFRVFSLAGEIASLGNRLYSFVGTVKDAFYSFFSSDNSPADTVETGTVIAPRSLPPVEEESLQEEGDALSLRGVDAVPSSAEESEIPTGRVAGASSSAARVIDGDTIVLGGGEIVRYIGVDAPELGKDEREACLAEEAKNRNEELVLGAQLRFENGYEDKDVYGRLLRYVWADDMFVNETLVREGYAYAYSFGFAHPYEAKFKEAEMEAKREKRGLWGVLCVDVVENGVHIINTTPKTEAQKTNPSSVVSSAALHNLAINEVKTQGGEFVELYNRGEAAVPLDGAYLAYYPSSRTDWRDPWRSKQFPSGATIPVGGYYLIALGEYGGVFDWQPYTTNQLGNSAGTLALWTGDPTGSSAQKIDAVGWGAVSLSEGIPAEPPAGSESIARGTDGADTDRNKDDFVPTISPTSRASNTFAAPVSSGNAGGTQSSQSDQGGVVAGTSTVSEEEDSAGIGEENTSSSPQLFPASVTHILISEILFDAEGSDAGKEFIELYNPAEVAIDLTGWKLTKDGSALLTIGSKTEDRISIPVRGFFLVGLSSYSGEPAADAVRSVSLSNSGAVVVLLDAEGEAVDEAVYGEGSVPGESVERRTWNGTCASAQGDTGEFLGNGCDVDLASDFETRAVPRPQNTESLPEPREAPALTGFSAEHHSSRPMVSFAWDVVEDANGNTEQITYVISEADVESGEPRELFRETGEREGADVFLDEVGRMYRFTVRAEDRDRLGSSIETELDVPGFLSGIYVYEDFEGKYRADFVYPSREFIPDAWSEGQFSRLWQAMVLYKNTVPDKQNVWLSQESDWDPQNTADAVALERDPEYAIIFGLNADSVGNPTGIFYERAFLLPEEDSRFSAVIASLGENEPLTEDDYFTVGYYDFDGAMGTRFPYLRLVAADHTRFSFRGDRSFQSPPAPPMDFSVGFNQFESLLSLSWTTSTDSDSPDGQMTYETQLAIGELTDDAWISHGTAGPGSHGLRTDYPIEYPNTYRAAVRAVDDSGNASEPAAREWTFPDGFTPYRLSRSLEGATQEFVLEEGGVLNSLQLFTANFSTNAKNPDTKTCAARIYEVTDVGDVLVAESDAGSSGYSCAGYPEFSFASVLPELTAGIKYGWGFSLSGPNPSTSAMVQFWGNDTDRAGGNFTTDDFKNAAFMLEGASGRLFSNIVE